MGMSLEDSLRLTVAALMQATGESQRVVAQALGLTQTQVSRRQAGVASWTLEDVEALAGHYGVEALDLLSGPTRACEVLPDTRRRSTTAGKRGKGGEGDE